MKKNILNQVSVMLIALALFFINSCIIVDKDDDDKDKIEVDNLRTEYQSVELGDADSVSVEIKMNHGELIIEGGTAQLMEADFVYNISGFRPVVKYIETDSKGLLKIKQKFHKNFSHHGNISNKWDLRFNNEIPMDFELKFGAGDCELKFGSLQLGKVELKLGAGDITVNLSGNQSITSLDIAMGIGNAEIDLTNINHNIDADIEGGIGNITLLLPDDVGVKVHAIRGLGKINAKGLKKDGNTFVNDAYSESEVTLLINIRAGIGLINLKLNKSGFVEESIEI